MKFFILSLFLLGICTHSYLNSGYLLKKTISSSCQVRRTLPTVAPILSSQLYSASSTPDIVDLSSLIEKAKSFENDALNSLTNAVDTAEVESLRVIFLGKNGKITGMMKEMKILSPSDKPKLGEVVNIAKVKVENAIEDAKSRLVTAEQDALIEKESMGNLIHLNKIHSRVRTPRRSGRRHPISQVLDLTTSIFQEIGYEVITGADESPEIENDFFNFEALGMPNDHPARDMQDTFYINKTGILGDDTLLLRTHTSAVQIRQMEKRTPPFKIVAPGRVYRKDDVDATHYPVFHQVEILAIDEIGKLTVPHLLGTVKYFLQKMFGPDIEVKYRASYFPFTEPSMEVDVYFRGRWLEVLGCGMVDPVVLEAVGYDPEKYSGFAAGFGVERFAMIMHQISDIRLFWENRHEFLQQFPATPYEIPGDDDHLREEMKHTIGIDDLFNDYE
jgi:phenylalanyl-tRNA synthetase alpha chain